MNHLFLPIALIVVYYLAAIANLISGFITNFSATKDESDVQQPASNLTILIGSLGVFLIWFWLQAIYFLPRGFICINHRCYCGLGLV
jgi:hypothetical protein